MLKKAQPLLKKFWPGFVFYRRSPHLDPFFTFLNYRRIWVISILILTAASMTPLWLASAIHHQLIQRSVHSDLVLRTERLTSNAKRSVAFFMEERLNALIFTVNEMGYDQLVNENRLQEVFNNLKLGFGGFTDLSLVDANGDQIAYVGPFNLEGKNYQNHQWFQSSITEDYFVSDVFTGYRDAPHIIIAVRSRTLDGSYFILRATLDTERLMRTLNSYRSSDHTDIFLTNQYGVLQTPSSKFGDILTQTRLIILGIPAHTQVKYLDAEGGKTAILGYSYIATDVLKTPFILMVHKEKEGVMQVWVDLGKKFNWIVGISGGFIVIIVTLISTFMVNRLYMADLAKAETLLQMEQSQQLASIGQLAAGIAHEINNPLALINETAGYIKDLYSFTNEKRNDAEIVEYIESILDAVERCGTITRQLLGFVRQFDIKIKSVDLCKMITNILNFHKKESEYRGIHVTADLPDPPLVIESDSGKLQQVLLNIINNAFQAIDEDGCLDVMVSVDSSQIVKIVIKDTGCGIPEENLKKIHEPFFSTKKEKMGTGLGLSITYGLVKKLQGKISVASTAGVGTIFTITLPVRIQKGRGE